MNPVKFSTLLITTLTLFAAQACLAASGSAYEPPTGRNGWQPAATGKALPQTAAVRAPAGGGSFYEPPIGRNGWQATTAKTLPLSATAKTRSRTASGSISGR